MPPLLQPFLGSGGLALAILGVLAWIAYARLSGIADSAQRWVAALSTPWLMRTAAAVAVGAWAWSFARQLLGRAYLRGGGRFAELSTVLALAVLVLAVVAWRGARPGGRWRPWRTWALVLVLVLAAGAAAAGAPADVLSQASGSDDRAAVAFVQGRLAHLGCFAAAGEPARRDGVFDPLTAGAVISFQQANGLLADPRLDRPGEVRPHAELRRLARPFPFLLGPEPCG